MTRFHKLALIIVFAIGPIGMALDPDAWSAVFQNKVSVGGISVDSRWPKHTGYGGYHNIRVCIVDSSDVHQEIDRDRVIGRNPGMQEVLKHITNALHDGWERDTKVRWSDFRACAALSDSERARAVGLWIHKDAPNRASIGVGGRGETNADDGDAAVNVKPWGKGGDGDACARYDDSTTRVEFDYDCVEQYALHEFGHSLGFLHEWYHPETPEPCASYNPDTESADPNDPAHRKSLAIKAPSTWSATYETDAQGNTTKNYTVVGGAYDRDSILTYNGDDEEKGCVDSKGEKVHFGSDNLSDRDRQGAAAVYGFVSTPNRGGTHDVGVFSDGRCGSPEPATDWAEWVTIRLDTEDENNKDETAGWTGMSGRSDGTSMRLDFCRVDGDRFRTYSGRYGLLKLGTECPGGSTEVTRHFDLEDDHNSSWTAGNARPNHVADNASLSFCVFPAAGGGAGMSEFPDLGFPYGVLGHSIGNATGWVFTDDEDDTNENSLDDPGAASYGGGNPLLEGGRNTRLYLAKVRGDNITMTLATSPRPSAIGSQVTVTARLSPATAGVPVCFQPPSGELCIASDSDGEAWLSRTDLPLGETLVPAYTRGTATFNPTYATVLHEVRPELEGPTTITSFPTNGSRVGPAAWASGCQAPAPDGVCGEAYDGNGVGVDRVEFQLRNPSGNYWDGAAFSLSESTKRWISANGVLPWSRPVPIDRLADGDYALSVRAVDKVGNIGPSELIHFTFDSTTPSATATFPQDDGAYNAAGWNAGCPATGLCGTAEDPGGGSVARVEVSLKRESTGRYWMPNAFINVAETWHVATGTDHWSLPVPATSLADGEQYTLRVRAINDSGTRQTDPLELKFHYDTTRATAAITHPDDGFAWNAARWGRSSSNPCGPDMICGTAADVGGVKEVEVEVVREADGVKWSGTAFTGGPHGFIKANGAEEWSMSLPAGALSTGKWYGVLARAADDAGNGAGPVTQSRFFFDDTRPSIAFADTLPTAGAIRADTFDGLCARVGVTGVGICGTASDTSPGAGLAGAISFVIHDKTALRFWDGSDWRTTPIVVEIDPAAKWKLDFARANLTSGHQYVLDATARDAAGNSGKAIATFVYDDVDPTVTTRFPAARAYNLKSWREGCPHAGICGSASDTGNSAVARVEVLLQDVATGLRWDGTAFTSAGGYLPAAGTTEWLYALDEAALEDGHSYAYRVKVLDGAGNVTLADPVSFSFDSTPPQLGQAFPAGGGAYNAAGWDGGCTVIGLCGTVAGADGLEITVKRGGDGKYWDGTGWVDQHVIEPSGGTSWSVSLPRPDLTSGESYTATVRAFDAAGNATSIDSSFVYDDQVPTVARAFPGAGSYNGAGWAAGCPTAGVCGTAADPGSSGVALVQLLLHDDTAGRNWDGSSFPDGAEHLVTAIGTSSWSHALPAAALVDGHAYTLSTIVTDRAGNVSVDRISFDYDVSAPTLGRTFPADDGAYNKAGWSGGGCAGGDGVCGTSIGVHGLTVAVRRLGDGQHWDGAAWVAGERKLEPSTRDTWRIPLPASALTHGHQYEITVAAVDRAGNESSLVSRFTYDTAKPTIDVRTPADEQRFEFNETVAADYSCGDATTAVVECEGTVADEAQLRTNRGGWNTFTVTAVDRAGNKRTETRSYYVRCLVQIFNRCLIR